MSKSKRSAPVRKKKHPVRTAFFTTLIVCFAAFSVVFALNIDAFLSCGGNPCAPFFGNFLPNASDDPNNSGGPNAPSSDESFQDYLNNTIFIGDSRTNGMVNFSFINRNNAYAIDGANHQTMRTNRFLTMSSTGRKLTIAEAIGVVKPVRMIVSFGINGVGFMGEEKFFTEYAALLDELKAASPDSILVVQSILPVSQTREAEDNRLTNAVINTYNQRLKALTLEKGGRWLDTANLLKNSQGSLNAIYDSGDGLHFNKRAYQVLFNYYDQHRIY